MWVEQYAQLEETGKQCSLIMYVILLLVYGYVDYTAKSVPMKKWTVVWILYCRVA